MVSSRSLDYFPKPVQFVIKEVSLSSSWRPIEKSTKGWKCRAQLTVVVPTPTETFTVPFLHQRLGEIAEEGGRKTIEVRWQGCLLWDWAFCLWWEITLESTTNGCLNKTWIMTTPEAILTWVGKYYKTPPEVKSYRQFMGCWERENWSSPL